MLFFFSGSSAQNLSLGQLEQMLNQTMDGAEESLFLIGYSFSGEDSIKNKGSIFFFSNRKHTIGTAKRVSKAVYHTEPLQSYIRYTTYDRPEFERLRRQMVEEQFIRDSKDGLSENSNYSKDHLKVKFEVNTDEYENSVFHITLRNSRIIVAEKPGRSFNLKKLINQRFRKEEEF